MCACAHACVCVFFFVCPNWNHYFQPRRLVYRPAETFQPFTQRGRLVPFPGCSYHIGEKGCAECPILINYKTAEKTGCVEGERLPARVELSFYEHHADHYAPVTRHSLDLLSYCQDTPFPVGLVGRHWEGAGWLAEGQGV